MDTTINFNGDKTKWATIRLREDCFNELVLIRRALGTSTGDTIARALMSCVKDFNEQEHLAYLSLIASMEAASTEVLDTNPISG